MSSRLHAIPLALAAGLIAAVLGGCGSTAATLDPVAEAAVATSHAGGAQMSLDISIGLPGQASPIKLSGSGDFNFADGEGELVSELTGLPAAASGLLHAGSIEFTELYAKGALYMRSPQLTAKLPGGARWIKLDLAELAQATGLDLQSLTSGQSNPAQVLEYLKASGGTVTRVGSETIRGIPTTHYRATINLAAVLRKEAAASHGDAAQAIEKLLPQSAGTTVPVEVWVDSHDLVRRMSMVLSESAAGERVKVLLALELFNFGATPSVNVPAPGEVLDATGGSLSALAGGS
jgi:hypothetical protein